MGTNRSLIAGFQSVPDTSNVRAATDKATESPLVEQFPIDILSIHMPQQLGTLNLPRSGLFCRRGVQVPD